jgi:hypothetical protein
MCQKSMLIRNEEVSNGSRTNHGIMDELQTPLLPLTKILA